MHIFGIDVTELANATIVLLTALVTWAAVYVGRRTTKPAPAAVSMQGAAIISNDPVIQLVNAIEGYTAALALARADDEKARATGQKLVETLSAMTGEIAEVRRDITNLTTELARRR